MTRRTFKLEENDIAFDTDRNIMFTSGDDEIAQALERAFTTRAGEWFLNALHGLEYEKIQGKGIRDEHIKMAVIRAALYEARVREVIEIQINRDNRNRTADISFLCRVANTAARPVGEADERDTGATIRVPFNANF